VLILNYLLRPVLAYIFGAAAGAFLFLVLALAVLYLSNNEKVNLS
jgi:zinc transporter ZupT